MNYTHFPMKKKVVLANEVPCMTKVLRQANCTNRRGKFTTLISVLSLVIKDFGHV